MGTETALHPLTNHSSYCFLVKLNNPLMGTETSVGRTRTYGENQ